MVNDQRPVSSHRLGPTCRRGSGSSGDGGRKGRVHCGGSQGGRRQPSPLVLVVFALVVVEVPATGLGQATADHVPHGQDRDVQEGLVGAEVVSVVAGALSPMTWAAMATAITATM